MIIRRKGGTKTAPTAAPERLPAPPAIGLPATELSTSIRDEAGVEDEYGGNGEDGLVIQCGCGSAHKGDTVNDQAQQLQSLDEDEESLHEDDAVSGER